MAPRKFAPRLNLPPRLQERLDNWRDAIPKWQHQVYGPLNSYLSIRFPPDQFIVKPQCLLREELATVDQPWEGGVSVDNVGQPWEEGVSVDSVDSHGQPVGHTRLYPDFCIDQYWGADDDSNPRADVIRVIIEVGSEKTGSIRGKTSKDEIEAQLEIYMLLAGPQRWEGRLLGVAMLGAEVLLLEMRDDVGSNEAATLNFENDPRQQPQPVFPRKKSPWIKMFDPRFEAEMDRMYQFSLAND
ncbi:MAG: hypothetical protein NXY57DRAFT_263424 [Lentinula lateritia]|uniref:Uncharacterized protein n=1 Tax=Lentinula aff. lateritia TaxID=2804960 RepID=A0ACC1TKZ4_9AGAR|nr:hypothetical protein F5876DRAFT_81952 [Lentinula aff. lateritia]KAJ3930997.1 MAG: hypothetical protein NXY57DRAFT_263424 [Lentinula lateritia]